MKKGLSLKTALTALAASFVWGTAFAFQRMAAGHIGAITFNFYRSVLAALALGCEGKRIAKTLSFMGPAGPLLEMLRRQELAHAQRFESMLDKIEDGSEDEPYDLETSSYLSAIAAEVVFPGGVLASMMNRRLETVRDVLLCAIGSEKDSLLFYMELLLNTRDEQTAQVLRAIIAEEKRHLVDLQQLLEKTR